MEIDSRVATVDDISVYVTSAPHGDWGQPPAGGHVIEVIGDRLLGQPIGGVYIPSIEAEDAGGVMSDQWDEPEDAILVQSGILPKLIAEAQQVPPSDDWERDLDEL